MTERRSQVDIESETGNFWALISKSYLKIQVRSIQ